MAQTRFIFVLFKLDLREKLQALSRNRTRIIGVEGEHADHSTTTSALQYYKVNFVNSLFAIYKHQPKMIMLSIAKIWSVSLGNAYFLCCK